MLLEETLDKILKRYEFLKQQMLENANDSESFIKLSKEFADLEDFANLIKVYNKTKAELAELQQSLKDPETDDEFKELAEEEIEKLQCKIPQLKKELKKIYLIIQLMFLILKRGDG